jgi:hypothetical protein
VPAVHTIHFCEKLVDKTLCGLVTRVITTAGGKSIHLVKEEDTGVGRTGTGKELPHRALTLTYKGNYRVVSGVVWNKKLPSVAATE